MIDLPYLEKWEVLQKKLNGMLYFGITHALFEYVMGLSQIYTTKKTIVVVEGQTFYFEDIIPLFLHQQMTVVRVKAHDILSPSEFITTLPEDTLMVLHALDHPVTGELFMVPDLEKLLGSKRIFSISVSHSVHQYKKLVCEPYAVIIQKVSEERALAIAGSRLRNKPVIAHRVPWNVQAEIERAAQIKPAALENKDLVLKLEAQTHPYAAPYFNHENRIFDRLVLKLSEIHASSLKSMLEEKNIKSETISNYENGFYKSTQGWWGQGHSENLSRELIIVPIEGLDPDHFKKSFEVSVQEILKLQSI